MREVDRRRRGAGRPSQIMSAALMMHEPPLMAKIGHVDVKDG